MCLKTFPGSDRQTQASPCWPACSNYPLTGSDASTSWWYPGSTPAVDPTDPDHHAGSKICGSSAPLW